MVHAKNNNFQDNRRPLGLIPRYREFHLYVRMELMRKVKEQQKLARVLYARQHQNVCLNNFYLQKNFQRIEKKNISKNENINSKN